MNKRIAVTGGAGFIGKYVCQKLEDRGIEPIVIDKSTGYDIQDMSSTDASWHQPDGVIHLAGVLGTEELFEDPQGAVSVNVNGSLTAMQMALSRDIPYVGITMPQVWDNIYQATKQCSQRLASAYHRHYGLKVSHVRAFNVYGPGQKVGSPQKIIPTFSSRAWAGEPLPVWGNGEQLVDLVYVEDVALMLFNALEFHDNQIFDAGTGVSFTVSDIARAVNDWTMNAAGLDYLPMRKGEHGDGVVAQGEGWEEIGYRPPLRMDAFKETVLSYKPDDMIGPV